MLDKLAGIEGRYEELDRLLAEVGSDYQRAAELNKERIEIEPIVEKARAYRQALSRREQAEQMLSGETDPDLLALAEAEIAELEPQIADLEVEIKRMLVPTDPRDSRDVIVEVRAGTGGDEAALFAADLFRMYSRYAERQNWKTEVMSSSEIGIGGFKEIIFEVKGKGAYSRLKFESGVHRVQRVPVTEAQGRIHTSTATVAVLAEVDEVEVNIPETDIEVEVYRSSGAGGQTCRRTPRRSASITSPPAWWWRVRTSARNCRTSCGLSRCCARGSMKWKRISAGPSLMKPAAHRSAAGNAARRSAPTITRKAGLPTTASGCPRITCPQSWMVTSISSSMSSPPARRPSA
jgi:protein subunit release factor A